jgi:glycosyltransferase involved in cell wall biosynthesis
LNEGKRGLRIAILAPNFFIKIKELHGADRIIFGGWERYIYDLVTLLQGQGHECTLFQSLQSPIVEGKRVHFGSIKKKYKDMNIVCLEDNADWAYGTNSSLNMTFNEMSLMYDLRIYGTTYMCHPFALRPCISICHGIWFDYAHYDPQLYDDVNKKVWLERTLYGFTAPDVCVSVDSNSKRVIQAIAPGKQNRISIIENYVDTEKFKPIDRPENERLKVLFPRRLTILRGCNEFIRASRDFPQYDYLSVGQATSEEAQNSLVQQMSANKHIQFIHKEMDGMEEVYQWADIGVVPTKASEGLSLSLLESMACGLPVVTTPVGGLSDAVINNYNALVFDPDHDDLGEAIHYLAQNPELRKVMGERNRQIAMECFDINIWKSRWMNIINSFC